MLNQSKILSLVDRLLTASTQTKTLGKMVHVALYGTTLSFSTTCGAQAATLTPLSIRLLYDRRLTSVGRRNAAIVIARLSFVTHDNVDNYIGSQVCLRGAGFEILGKLHRNRSDHWLHQVTNSNHVYITVTSITHDKHCSACKRKSIVLHVDRLHKP